MYAVTATYVDDPPVAVPPHGNRHNDGVNMKRSRQSDVWFRNSSRSSRRSTSVRCSSGEPLCRPTV